MKKFFTTCLMLMLVLSVYAQGGITGKLIDADTKEDLIGASVYLEGTTIGTVTSYDGTFNLRNVAAGSHNLIISYTGYSDKTMAVTCTDQITDLGSIEMGVGAFGLSEIKVVASIAIDRKTPVAVSTISADEIEAKLGNQEFPEILKSTPSVYTSKGNGGFGDARISVRGFSQENLALLINGIPVNGMEDNKVYWSNWAGLGDVTRTIQVQRGLGASRLAVASVGGTINVITKTTDQERGGAIHTSIGNNGYNKTGLTLSTGRMDSGWAVTFSGSRTTGDGYIEGGYIDAWNYFGSIAKELGDKAQLMFTVFGAPQKHGQRSFEQNIGQQRNELGTRWNDDFGYYQGRDFTFRENFYHKPQASLTHIWEISPKTSLVTSAYGSTGRGGGTGDIGNAREYLLEKDRYGHQQFDEIAKWNAGQENNLKFVWGQDVGAFNDYNYLTPGATDTLSGRILSNEGGGTIKRASMNEHQWYGVLSTLNTQLSDNLNLNGGLDLRWYTGSHYRKTIDLLGGDYWFDTDNINNRTTWVDLDENGEVNDGEMGNLIRPQNKASRLFGAVDEDQRIDYYNDENINWYGAFAQLEYSVGDLSAFLSGAVNSTQMRRIDYFSQLPENQTTDWTTFIGGNVKLGANYNINAQNNVFINTGYISRAPYFDVLYPTFDNDDPNTDVLNEGILAFELGYGYKSRNFRANVNGYFTQWSDKSEVYSDDFELEDGTEIRDATFNLLGVDALHTGVEIDLNWQPIDALNFRGFASLNDWQWKNEVETVVTDDTNVEIGRFPVYLDGIKVGNAAQTTMGIGASWTIGAGVSIDMQANYFDNLYTSYDAQDRNDKDLVGHQALLLPSYGLVDGGLTWKFKLGNFDAQARANVNNIFDKEYVAEAVDRIERDADSVPVNRNDNRDAEEYSDLLNSTRGWFGFGRTWNVGLKVRF